MRLPLSYMNEDSQWDVCYSLNRVLGVNSRPSRVYSRFQAREKVSQAYVSAVRYDQL
jgi:hypothetical protein